MQKGRKFGSKWGRYCFLFKKKTSEHSAQFHVFAQSPPDRRPNDKYPVNTSQLCKHVSLQCYLVVTVIHIQSVGSRMCIHVLHNIEMLVG